jgi:DNA-directed RNA polymerase subunit RPC12/RpoP
MEKKKITEEFVTLKPDEYIVTEGNEDIEIVCKGCNKTFNDWSNIFEGHETSYVCPYCGYEGFAWSNNTQIRKREVQGVEYGKEERS